MQTPIGFIGTGIMGLPMAANLLKAGFSLIVYNRTREKAAPLLQAGAQEAATPREVARGARKVILMLTGPPAIDSVLEGENGLLAGMHQGGVVINMSTVPPAYSRTLAGRLSGQGITLIDAPVSGSRKPAEEGSLVILASGPEEEVLAMEKVFLAMGKQLVYCGPAGHGSAMKMAVNLLLAVMMTGLAEAVNLGQRCGLSPRLVLDTILAGPLACGLFQLKAEMLERDSYPPQFPLKHMDKDLGFILETAREQAAAVACGQTCFELFERAMQEGLGDMDLAAVKKVISQPDKRADAADSRRP